MALFGLPQTYVHIDRCDTLARDMLDPDLVSGHRKAGKLPTQLHFARGIAGNQRAQGHVTTDPGETIEIGRFHVRRNTRFRPSRSAILNASFLRPPRGFLGLGLT